MIRRPRARWLLERLSALLLCFGIAAAFHLWQALRPSRAPAEPVSVPDSPLYRRVGHVNFDSAPLEQVLNELSRQTGQRILVDWDDLAEHWGQGRRADVTLHVDHVTLLTALNRTFYHAALSPLRLEVNAEGEITVTTFDHDTAAIVPAIKPPAKVYVRDYEVADLLESFSDAAEASPPPPAAGSFNGGLFGGGGTPFLPQSTGIFSRSVFVPESNSERGRAMSDLVVLLESDHDISGDPDTEPPVIRPLGSRLVIMGTSSDHRRVGDLLQSLRTASKLNPDDPPRSGAGR